MTYFQSSAASSQAGDRIWCSGHYDLGKIGTRLRGFGTSRGYLREKEILTETRGCENRAKPAMDEEFDIRDSAVPTGRSSTARRRPALPDSCITGSDTSQSSAYRSSTTSGSFESMAASICATKSPSPLTVPRSLGVFGGRRVGVGGLHVIESVARP